MDYDTFGDDHVLTLTEEETDRFFDPFDPTDKDLPSHLHYSRHRFIKDDVYDWLEANVGAVGVMWNHQPFGYNCKSFHFRKPNHAMLFKLTYGGNNGSVD